ncbi:MAG TPA: hypothetical protein VIW24_21355 [Aldersonia sp.]
MRRTWPDHRITSAGEALDAALTFASLIAVNGPLAVRAAKQVIIESADWTNAEAFDRQEAIVDPIRRSDQDPRTQVALRRGRRYRRGTRVLPADR